MHANVCQGHIDNFGFMSIPLKNEDIGVRLKLS